MKKKTEGMTMVEVIVAFAVLMIGLAGIYKVTLMSWNMVVKAVTIQAEVDDLMNQYYEEKLPGKTLTDEKLELEDRDKNSAGEFNIVIKGAENSEGYHIYYYETPKVGGK